MKRIYLNFSTQQECFNKKATVSCSAKVSSKQCAVFGIQDVACSDNKIFTEKSSLSPLSKFQAYASPKHMSPNAKDDKRMRIDIGEDCRHSQNINLKSRLTGSFIAVQESRPKDTVYVSPSATSRDNENSSNAHHGKYQRFLITELRY